MSVKNHIQDVLTSYALIFGRTTSVQAFELFMEAHEDLCARTNLTGHITGSALVFDKSSHMVLRVRHAKLNRWIFSAGGHVDKGELPWQTSVRELFEETGMAAKPLFDEKKPIPLIVDVHPIPANLKKREAAHWHYDLVYLFEVEQRPIMKADPNEILEFHWVDVADVTHKNSPLDLDEQMLRYKA